VFVYVIAMVTVILVLILHVRGGSVRILTRQNWRFAAYVRYRKVDLTYGRFSQQFEEYVVELGVVELDIK